MSRPLKRDQEKWVPVFRPITRPAKESGAGHEAALFPPKAIPLQLRQSCDRHNSLNEISRRRIRPRAQGARSRSSASSVKPADALELGMIAQHLRQPVVGDAAAKVMHMVHADIGGEPAQDGRQIVVRAAMQRRLVHGPAGRLGPERILELMLDIEQPDPDRGREQRRSADARAGTA